MNLVYCYIEHPVSAIDQRYTYQFHDEHIVAGMRIRVNFAHRDCVAFVDEVVMDTQEKFTFEIKEILSVIDEEPVLNEELINLGKWLAETTVSPDISCFQAMLPAKLKPKSNRQRIKTEKWVRPLQAPQLMTPKRQAAYDLLVSKHEMRLTEWRLTAKTVGKALEECHAVEVFDKEVRTQEKALIPTDFDLT